MTKARDLANGGFGLVLIKPSSVVNGTDNGKGTVSFSAQSTVSLNNVFNSTYDSYRVVFNNIIHSSGNVLLRLRWRKAGSDNSSSIYYSSIHDITWTGVAGAGSSQAASTSAAPYNLASTFGSLVIDVNNPLVRPMFTGLGTAAGPLDRGSLTNGFINGSDTFDGFTFFPASGTITGTVSVYGYNK